MKSSAGKVLTQTCFRLSLVSAENNFRLATTCNSTAINVQEDVLYDCTPNFDNALSYLNSSTGTRRLKVTLQDHKTRLSGIVGSKLHISGWFNRTN